MMDELRGRLEQARRQRPWPTRAARHRPPGPQARQRPPLRRQRHGHGLRHRRGDHRRAHRQRRAATLTQVGTSIGTPAYMAPERASADPADHRVDFYAFGVVAWEMIAPGSGPRCRV